MRKTVQQEEGLLTLSRACGSPKDPVKIQILIQWVWWSLRLSLTCSQGMLMLLIRGEAACALAAQSLTRFTWIMLLPGQPSATAPSAAVAERASL